MAYHLIARNKRLNTLTIGVFSFPIILEVSNYIFPCIHNKGKWYCVFGEDRRFPVGGEYPSILAMDGFRVTAEESKIMARMVRNYVVIQEVLERENSKDNWPEKIRKDFVESFAKFVIWAEKSRGFTIN